MADNYSSHVEKADGTVGNGRRSSVVQATEIDMNTVALDDDVFRRMSVAIPNLEQVTGQAKDATDMEHDMTAWEAVKLYPKAVVFSAVMSLAIVMGEAIPHCTSFAVLAGRSTLVRDMNTLHISSVCKTE